MLKTLNLPKTPAPPTNVKPVKGAAVPEVENASKVPLFVLEHLNKLNLNQNFKSLFDAVNNLPVFAQILQILQQYYRESEFQLFSRMLGNTKQLYLIPRAVIPILQI